MDYFMLIPYNKTFTEVAEFYATSTDGAGAQTFLNLSKTFARGAVAGFVFEDFMSKKLGAYSHSPQSKGFDYIHKKSGRMIECRSFTSGRLQFSRSINLGGSRKALDGDDFVKEASSKDYIIGDMTRFAEEGVIRFIKLRGTDVAKLGPTLTKSQALALFK